jgi:hypothetical protein
MMNSRSGYSKKILLGLLIVILAVACVDVIEKDITKEIPVLISPADSVIEYGTLTFWWTEIKGATHYRLQLVRPSFDSPQRLYLDTLVSSDRFDYNPDPGIYQWRVQGVNSAYSSAFSEHKSLEIIEGNDLGRVEIVVRSPVKDFVTSNGEISFSWDLISIADGYRFQLFNATEIVVDDTTTSNGYGYELPEVDGNYEWQITAFNETSESISERMMITLDKTAPTAPELVFPKADSLVDFAASGLEFTWTRKSTDVGQDSFVIINEDGTAVPGFSAIKLNSPSIEVSNAELIFKTDSTYLWRVISIDKAGNLSPEASRPFTVTQQ